MYSAAVHFAAPSGFLGFPGPQRGPALYRLCRLDCTAIHTVAAGKTHLYLFFCTATILSEVQVLLK